MSRQPEGPVAEEVANQIANVVAVRKEDVTKPASERAHQTEKNNAGTSLPDKRNPPPGHANEQTGKPKPRS